MDLNSALDIIIRDLREAREIIDDLKNVKGVSIIQVELAKAKCKSAEEIIELLKTIEHPQIIEPAPEPEIPAPLSEKISKEIIPEPLMELEAEPADATAAAETRETDDRVKHPEHAEPVNATAGAEIRQTDNPVKHPEHIEPAPVVQKEEGKSVKGKPILADRYGEPADRVNERMRGTRGDNDISAKLKQSPISNLASAIGVNDRFLYIREVFGGNREAYNNAIEKLNSVSSSIEAEKIINDYSPGEVDSAAVKSLLELVRRKTGFNG